MSRWLLLLTLGLAGCGYQSNIACNGKTSVAVQVYNYGEGGLAAQAERERDISSRLTEAILATCKQIATP